LDEIKQKTVFLPEGNKSKYRLIILKNKKRKNNSIRFRWNSNSFERWGGF